MMPLRYFYFSFSICSALTFIFLVIVDKSIIIFIPTFLIHILAFLILLLSNLFFKILRLNHIILNFIISFLLSYFFIIFVFWKINQGDFFMLVLELHKVKNFIVSLLPYIISNIYIVLYTKFQTKQAQMKKD